MSSEVSNLDYDVEILRLEKCKENLQLTMKQVMDFPKKVSYNCMIPLSSVAFTPGKIVHTNEFRLAPCDNDFRISSDNTLDKKLLSYLEIHEILENRTNSLNLRLSSLRNSSQLVNTSKSSMFNANSNKNIEDMKTNKVISSTKKEKLSTASSTRIKQTSPKYEEFEQDLNLPVLEIREFTDESGTILRQEVVDLKDEMRGVVQGMKSMQMNQHQDNRHDTTEKIKEVDIAKLEALEQSIQKMTTGTRNDDSIMDDDLQLVRDLARSSMHYYSDDLEDDELDSDWLQKLEDEEELQMAEDIAAARIRSREAELLKSDNNTSKSKSKGASVSAGAGAGWKKGFFGNTSNKKPQQLSSQEGKNKVKAPESVPSPVPVQSTISSPSKISSSSVPSNNFTSSILPIPSSMKGKVSETVHQDKGPIVESSYKFRAKSKGNYISNGNGNSNSNSGINTVRPKAFSGKIIEKFP